MLRTQKPLESINKETLARLIFNKNSQRLVPKSKNALPCTNQKIQAQSEDLDFDDYVRFCCGYRHMPCKQTLQRLSNGNILNGVKPDNWKLFALVVSGASLHQLNDPNYYDIVIRSKCMYPESFYSSIEKDIYRTMTKSSLETEKLRNVLYAYAIRNPSLLYCQGLNFVVANFLLAGFTEQESFWILTSLIEEVLPVDYYTNLKPIICLNSLFNDLLRASNNEFLILCQRVGLETSFFLIPWLVTLFGKGFSRELSDYILPLILLENEIGLMKVGLTLIKVLQPKLPWNLEFGVILKDIQALQPLLTVEQFKKQYNKIYINSHLFKVLMRHYLDQYPEEQCRSFTRKFELKRRTLPQCSPQYEVCLQILQIQREYRNMKEIQTIRVKKNLDDLMDPNFFDHDQCAHRSIRISLASQFLEQIMVGRHTHVCTSNSKFRRANSASSDKISCICISDNEESFEELQLGQVRTRDLGPQKSKVLQEISTQFQILEIVEDQELVDPAEELKSRRQLVKSLSMRQMDFKIDQFSTTLLITDLIGKLLPQKMRFD